MVTIKLEGVTTRYEDGALIRGLNIMQEKSDSEMIKLGHIDVVARVLKYDEAEKRYVLTPNSKFSRNWYGLKLTGISAKIQGKIRHFYNTERLHKCIPPAAQFPFNAFNEDWVHHENDTRLEDCLSGLFIEISPNVELFA